MQIDEIQDSEYVLIEAHTLIDAHHPSAKNKSQ